MTLLDFARRARRHGMRALHLAWAWASPWLARIEPVWQPRSVMRGETPLGRRVVVFCHYDPRGQVAEHVRRYVLALRDIGLSVVFVSNSGWLRAEAQAWLLGQCAWLVVRRNTGFDFAAWRSGLAVARLPEAETELLILANDSVYGPIRPLGPLLARMQQGEADVWSMTDTWQHRYHLQSYFLVFGPAALHSAAFAGFWRTVRDLRSKLGVIRQHEIGLTQALLGAGLRCRALWRYVDLVDTLRTAKEEAAESERPLEAAQRAADARHEAAAARRVALNPTAELWRALVMSGFPFLKRELLRRNPAGVPDVAAWLDVVRAVSPEDAEVILRDLARSLRNSAP